MSGSKWTAGPWSVGDVDRIIGEQIINGPAGSAPIAGVYFEHTGRSEEEDQANARRIEAAPKLADLLQFIVDGYGVGTSPSRFCANIHDTVMEARSELAKARGEDPPVWGKDIGSAP